jgi:hypothetical protein
MDTDKKVLHYAVQHLKDFAESQTWDVIFYLEMLKRSGIIKNYSTRDVSENKDGIFYIDLYVMDKREIGRIDTTLKDFYNAKRI